jgi:ABC-type dipeptide/oligopeptide/nickel transport system ATPase component
MSLATQNFLMRFHPLLTIENLAIRFRSDEARGHSDVVHDFNLEIFPGETLALVGESGCGKTTVALAILRLIDFPGQITNGKIFFRKENLLALPEKRLRQIRWQEIAMIFQEPASALNPLRRVGSQVTEVLRLHLHLDAKTAKRRALQLFESVRLPEASRCFDLYPHELSSGMRQRTMIAMALACEPKLLIADEPTTALDVRTQQEVLDCLLRQKQEKGLSLLFISHNLGLVAAFADRVAIMHEGRVVEVGTAAEILKQPQHSQTWRLLEAARRFNPDGLCTNTGRQDARVNVFEKRFEMME